VLFHKQQPPQHLQEQLLEASLNQTQAGMIIKLNLAVQEDSYKLETTVQNVMPQMSLTQLTKLASLAPQTIPTVMLLKDVNVLQNVTPQEPLIQQIINVNAKF
jgi:hypothetical protein